MGPEVSEELEIIENTRKRRSRREDLILKTRVQKCILILEKSTLKKISNRFFNISKFIDRQ